MNTTCSGRRGAPPWPQLVHHLRPSRHAGGAAASLALLAFAACADAVTAPRLDEESVATARSITEARAQTGTTVRWNALARQLVASDRVAPPPASRLYAYLSVAQYASALAALDLPPNGVPSSPASNPAQRRVDIAIAAASARILASTFPNHSARIDHELQTDLASLVGRSENSSVIRRAQEIAGAIVAHLQERARTDGADITWTGTVPNGPGFWRGSAPQLPAWGLVRPWLFTSGTELRAPPPPSFDSDAFRTALAEVRQIADTRTAAQLEIARFWADGAGTSTPPGHWNEIAADLIRTSGIAEVPAARMMALVNIAMMDAFIGCWDSKFTYWLVRPWQADAGITTPIGQPPHPSYPSGHACGSGAAAGVLGALVPARAAEFERMAIEACDSRVYAGIHYRFDAVAGMAIGNMAAARAVQRADALVRTEIVRAIGALSN